MELTSKTIHLHRDIVSISQNASGDRLVLLCSSAAGSGLDQTTGETHHKKQQRSLHFLKAHPSAKSASSPSFTPCGVVESCDAHTVLLDASGSFVFTTSQDSSLLTVFPFTTADAAPEETLIELDFKHSICAVHNLYASTTASPPSSDEKNADNSATGSTPATASISTAAVVSVSGEIAVVRVERRENQGVKVTQKTFSGVNIDSVFTTSSYNDTSIVIYSPASNKKPGSLAYEPHVKTEEHHKFTFYVVRFSVPWQSGSIKSSKVVISTPVVLSTSSSLERSSRSHRRKSSRPSSSRNPLLAASLLPHCANLLLSDGTMHIFAPKRRKTSSFASETNLDAWFTTATSTNSSCLIRSSKICSPPSTNNKSFGTILPIRRNRAALNSECDTHHMLVAYNKCLSIWDTTYHIMHGQLHNTNPIRQVCLPNPSCPVICDQSGIRAVEINSNSVDHELGCSKSPFHVPSLARAVDVMRQQSEGHRSDFLLSAEVLSPSFSKSSSSLAVQAHIDARDAITKAAHAGGSLSTVFDPVLENAVKQEMANLRTILAASNVKEIQKLKQVTINPSNRVAALFATRCLIALVRSPLKEFCKPSKSACILFDPLIDMIASGAVSSTAVVQLFNSWPYKEGTDFDDDDDDSENEDDKDLNDNSDNMNGEVQGGASDFEITSIVDAVLAPYLIRRHWLMQNPEHILNFVPFNVLEAIILKVPDLLESDIVRIMLFAAQMCRFDGSDQTENETMNDPGTDHRKQGHIASRERVRRAHVLLDRAVHTSVDPTSAVSALRDVPFDDVLVLFDQLQCVVENAENHLENPLSNESSENRRLSEITRVPNTKDYPLSRKSNYRGFGAWLDFQDAEISHTENHYNIENGVQDKKDTINGNEMEDDNESDGDEFLVDSVIDISSYVEWMSRAIDAHFTNFIMDPHGQGSTLINKSLTTVESVQLNRRELKTLDGMARHLTEKRKLPKLDHPLYTVRKRLIPAHFTIM